MKSEAGFSLIELITVIILLGIISVAALGKLNISGFDERGYTDELTSALRYAQKIAVANNCGSSVALINGSGFTLTQPSSASNCSSYGIPILNPTTGQSFSSNEPDGITSTIEPDGIISTIQFKSDGSVNSVNSMIELSVIGSTTSYICIAVESGYVYKKSVACLP